MSSDGSAYSLRGYGVEDFIAAFETAFKEKPEVYWYMLSLLRTQPIHISEEDMKYFQGEPAPLKITIPNILIEESVKTTTSEHSDPDFGCNLCGFHHPEGRCLDS